MSTPLKVLIVEDNPDDAELSVVELRLAGFEPEWVRVDTEAAYLANLHRGLDLVLADFQMPSFNGFRALELLNLVGLDIPFILVSGTIGEDVAVEAIKRGATDYLMKDRLARLGTAVTHALTETRSRRERRRAVGAEQRQLSELRVLVDMIPAMVWFKDVKNRILRVNQRVADAVGKSVEEIEGKPASEIYPQNAGKTYADDSAVIHSGAPKLGAVETVLGPDGQEQWVQTDKVPVRDKDGETIGLIVMAQDITERKQAEAARLVSEERFRSYFELGLIGMAITSPTMGLLEFNYEVCGILGYTREELCRKTWAELTHPDDLAEDFAKFDRVCAGEMDGYSMEKRFLRKDGGIVQAMIAVKCVRHADGTVDYCVALLQDITERKRADLALRESEQRFKALFEQAAVGVAQGDAATGRFVQVNQRFCEIVAYGREELEQLTFADITHPYDVAASLEKGRQLLAGTLREFSAEKRYLRKDRTEVWVSVTVSAMWTPGEPPDYFIAVVQDITERKRFDEHFLQAQKMEALGQFSGGVAHDFNNILATISGYTELSLLLLTDNPGVREHLDSVLKAAGRAAELVKQILTFSRQQPQERHAIQLRPVVEESIKLMRAAIPSTIAFDTDIAADAPTVFANANQVHQVLMNLGINAWHAMKDQSGRLQIVLEHWEVDEAQAAAQPRLRPGRYARVSLSDNGSGMDAATLRRIFEPFFTTKPVGEGTGLGLAVVHGIMDGHDGVVTVASRPGEGTVFHLYFPAHTGEATLSAIAEGPVLRGHGETVLVVDDEEMIAAMMQNTLSRLGYAAEFATNPLVALALVQADPARFQLVLSDQAMPGMSGLELANRLREIRPDLPVMLMTGFSASLTPERVQRAGVRQVLLKPLTLHQLGAAIHAVLSTTFPP